MSNGKDFEQDVLHLLSLHGWQVSHERLCGHKKVDGYAEKTGEFGRRNRIAIECKDYSKQMHQAEVTRIYANYLPLIDEGHIDEIVLVTKNDLAPSAKTYALKAKNLTHIRYIELLNSLLDCASYIQALITKYESDEVSKFYVPQCFSFEANLDTNSGLVENELLKWIARSDPQPVAILAGYGMGKTTLSKRLAYLLADKHRNDPSQRIPILIPLEELSTEQSLEGLLGKHFTSTAVIRNYCFDIFMALNQRGRFVIFLDGFDEMKHTMSWDTMRFNFQQLNRLISENSKVVLSGRPTAFLTEEEQVEVLHGKRAILGVWKQIPGWPDYTELYLQAFSRDQIQQFIKTYALILNQEQVSEYDVLLSKSDYSKSPTTSGLLSLATRPVQLRMLLEILPTWEKDFDSLTVAILYSEFIDLIIRREMKKHARRAYSLDERREFVRDLAWWMWDTQPRSHIVASRIPDGLFLKFLTSDLDLSEVKRDLLSACFIEVKQPEGYYFPHRSFQEFLVAEKIVSLIRAGKIPTEDEVLITSEISQFFEGIVNKVDLHHFKELVWGFRGTLPQWLLDLLLNLIDDPSDVTNDVAAMRSPWAYVLIASGIRKQKWELKDPSVLKFLRHTLDSLPPGASPKVEWAKLFVTLNIWLRSELESLGYEKSTRLLELLRQADTANMFSGRRKVPSLSLLLAHESKDFCYVNALGMRANDSQQKYFNLGRMRDDDQRQENRKFRKRKSPHKLLGVTRKTKY